MIDYSEPDLVYLLKRLASLNYKSQPKSHRKTPVTNESWGRAACQKRRLQRLKGQKPYYKIYVALTVLLGAVRQEFKEHNLFEGSVWHKKEERHKSNRLCLFAWYPE
ncbi:hypothetical protein FOIG_16802 [Fusarium odoratissimum NRRL 54006]|uniref:Uncharacterized protein n=1 Tax=Fusarium odoratissimum (strain NRRL 54006) TaxID=1089451 RepID=X0J0Z0_FUSO5|nr:uncharacterized protein FOIG_16802 [Fusarium odoratissimum NRRL 54006]EXL89915.1 hypothetical protein FOIG_16802 [Fusarium odoratissimum NRRL 54006]